MDWHQLAIFAAPITTAIFAFLLNKYFQNKPRLIAFRGYVSVHKIPSTSGYKIFSLAVNAQPNIATMNRLYSANIPMLIKHDNQIWIYGFDQNSNPQLTQSQSADLYKHIEFKEEVVPVENVSAETYDEILSSGAHLAKIFICTHSLVVRNGGKLPAHNVRIVHKMLPDYHIYPNLQYSEIKMTGSAGELLFPILVPNEQVTISYLYFPPNGYTDINDYVKSDEGFAKFIEVMPTLIFPKWFLWLLLVFVFIGFSTALYFAILFTYSLYCCISM